MLSLMTIKEVYEKVDGKADIVKAINNVAHEENRYLVEALKILDREDKSARRIQDKFGRDFKAATKSQNS